MKCTPKVGQIKFNFGGAFFMSKYSEEFKLKIVQEHNETRIGEKKLEKKYGVSRSHIREWIKQYELKGSFFKPKRRIYQESHSNHQGTESYNDCGEYKIFYD